MGRQGKPGRPQLNWPPAAMDRLRQLHEAGMRPSPITAILSAEFGIKVTRDHVRHRIFKLGLKSHKMGRGQIVAPPAAPTVVARYYGREPTLPPLASLTFGDD